MTKSKKVALQSIRAQLLAAFGLICQKKKHILKHREKVSHELG